jgi:hypothetical protein
MAMDHNQGRRGHFHRGRRGPDRRGPDRRGPVPEQTNRAERLDRVDVEQIMRDIRSRIAQRSGVDLSNQQIQELAARRLEAILDPRGLKPELLDQLRRSAGDKAAPVDDATVPAAQSFPFDEASLYDSPNALLRFIRKLLHPVLRILFNPSPVAHALAQQSRFNSELAARDAERDRRQAEWNALHFEILKRLALDLSRSSIETQNLLLRVESLSTKVDFNERRVRTLEGTQAQVRQPRPDSVQAVPGASAAGQPEPVHSQPSPADAQPGSETPRRRRRRRRGRRGPGMTVPADAAAATASSAGDVITDSDEGEPDVDEGFEDEVSGEHVDPPEEMTTSDAPRAAEEQPEPPPAEHRPSNVPEE